MQNHPMITLFYKLGLVKNDPENYHSVFGGLNKYSKRACSLCDLICCFEEDNGYFNRGILFDLDFEGR